MNQVKEFLLQPPAFYKLSIKLQEKFKEYSVGIHKFRAAFQFIQHSLN